jgi:hypothetical protein
MPHTKLGLQPAIIYEARVVSDVKRPQYSESYLVQPAVVLAFAQDEPRIITRKYKLLHSASTYGLQHFSVPIFYTHEKQGLKIHC